MPGQESRITVAGTIRKSSVPIDLEIKYRVNSRIETKVNERHAKTMDKVARC
jgi:hypothetical protein